MTDLPIWVELTDLAHVLRPPDRRPQSWRREVARVLAGLGVEKACIRGGTIRYFTQDLKDKAPAIVEAWMDRLTPTNTD